MEDVDAASPIVMSRKKDKTNSNSSNGGMLSDADMEEKEAMMEAVFNSLSDTKTDGKDGKDGKDGDKMVEIGPSSRSLSGFGWVIECIRWCCRLP